jgi:hypothetical protein
MVDQEPDSRKNQKQIQANKVNERKEEAMSLGKALLLVLLVIVGSATLVFGVCLAAFSL